MRRSYFCAAILAALFACIHLTGCGGGGTPVLMVSTTSLPNGVVGTQYSATLVATGGTPGYTWSQLSGGDMPGGVSLGGSGTFNGTPTTAGTFGPYIFEATDSAGAVAQSAGLSITIAANALAVTTASLPQGIANTPYSFTLAASGGTPPYSWAETSGGVLPPGITNVTSAGIIAGTPTTTGTYGPYVFTVTDSTKATASSASLTFTVSSAAAAACIPLGNESALTSSTPYAFLVKGTDASGNPIDIAGSFTPNGSGGITNGTVDYNGFSNGPQELQVNPTGSSYAFGSSTLGCLSLIFYDAVPAAVRADSTGASPHFPPASMVRVKKAIAHAAAASVLSSVQFAFSLSGFDGTLYHTGRIIESDAAASGTNASGFIHLQDPTTFSLASLQPNYAFGLDGWTADSTSYFRTSIAGTFTNTSGALSAGFADMDSGGTPSGELTGGGGTLNSTIDATTGRGAGTYTIPTASGNLTFDLAFYLLNGTDFILLSIDSPTAVGSAPLLSGRALASSATYAAGALNDYYLLAAQGLGANASAIGNLAEIGTLNATNTGAIPTATLYANNAGTFATLPYSNASYTVEAASGRVSITGLSLTPPVLYLTAATTDEEIAAFLVGTDTESSSGAIISQSTDVPAYVLSDVSGNYAASTQEDVDGLNGAFLGAFSFTATGQYSSTQQTTGTVPTLPTSGSIAINPDGSGNLNGGNFPLVTNGTVIFAIPASGDPLLYVFTAAAPPN